MQVLPHRKQAGDGTEQQLTPKLVPALQGVTIRRVVTQSNSNLAVSRSGDLYSWGFGANLYHSRGEASSLVGAGEAAAAAAAAALRPWRQRRRRARRAAAPLSLVGVLAMSGVVAVVMVMAVLVELRCGDDPGDRVLLG